MKALVLLSGGLDSTVLMYHLKSEGYSISAILFDYGQANHHKELRCARMHCDIFNHRHGETFGGWSEVELPTIYGSTLTGKGSTKVVPNRNAILLSFAVSVASANHIPQVAYGCNATDAKDFPDCRIDFINAMNRASASAETGVSIIAPFWNLTKRQIVKIGRELDVPMEATWSCYQGGDSACEVCDACVARREAFL